MTAGQSLEASDQLQSTMLALADGMQSATGPEAHHRNRDPCREGVAFSFDAQTFPLRQTSVGRVSDCRRTSSLVGGSLGAGEDLQRIHAHLRVVHLHASCQVRLYTLARQLAAQVVVHLGARNATLRDRVSACKAVTYGPRLRPADAMCRAQQHAVGIVQAGCCSMHSARY